MPGGDDTKVFSLPAVAALLTSSEYHLFAHFQELKNLVCFLLEQPNACISCVVNLKSVLPEAKSVFAEQYPEYVQEFDEAVEGWAENYVDDEEIRLSYDGPDDYLKHELNKYLAEYSGGEFKIKKPSVYRQEQQEQLVYYFRMAFWHPQQQAPAGGREPNLPNRAAPAA